MIDQTAVRPSSNGRTRRAFVFSLAASLGFGKTAGAVESVLAPSADLFRLSVPTDDVVNQVTPKAGVPTGVAFGDSIQRLIAAGVVDPAKFRASEPKLPGWVERLLEAPSDDSIVFSEEAAPHLVGLLWPLGLANRASFNEKSPIYTLRIPGFASTGGWTLGRAQNGYVYFNQVDAVPLTGEQQSAVLEVATNTFRPCCDNSTFFQDCNHGSALLGLLELAASQGATLKGLYGLALTANSFWFPDHYAKTALFFAHFHHKRWRDLQPKLVLGADFSSLSGWEKNVNDRLLKANVVLPGQSKSQQAC